MAQPETTRTDYPHLSPIQTRWADNDVYGHVNNVAYYAYFDTIVNTYLVNAGVLDIHTGSTIGLVVETGCKYYQSLGFPEPLDGGLRVSKIGTSSVCYDLAIFKRDHNLPAAEGRFVHVYVDKTSRRPVTLPEVWRNSLSILTI